MLLIDYVSTMLSVRADLSRQEARSFATALRSMKPDAIVFVSFLECSYVDLAALSALAAHDAAQAAQLVVIVPEAGYVRSQFELSGLAGRLGVVSSFDQAYERAGRLRLLADITERACRAGPPDIS